MVWDNPNGSYETIAYSTSGGGFSGNGSLVVKFTTPPIPNLPTYTTAPNYGKGAIGVSEYQGPPTFRTGSLSTQPCDFSTGITGFPGLSTAFSADVDPIVYFTLGYAKAGYVELQPSTTYYLNVNNYVGSVLYCSSGTCDVILTLNKQPGS